MNYLYGATDTKFKRRISPKKVIPIPPHKFRRTPLLERRVHFDHSLWPLPFHHSPTPLLELCIAAVDEVPLTSVFEWDCKAARRWILRYGYPQYVNTFRVNKIKGRKLLLLDAAALSAMNIKDFDHIKHITYGIRMLIHFELTKFSHSISLPDEKPNELYLLWHTQTGVNYDALRRSDFYTRMRLIRERSKNLEHWDLLELWLRREREHNFKELIGGMPRFNMYIDIFPSNSTLEEESSDVVDETVDFLCSTPSEFDAQGPWQLNCLKNVKSGPKIGSEHCSKNCSTCCPPCECDWSPRHYLTGTVISCLKRQFPKKFAPLYEDALQWQESVQMRWMRFSI
ncbi:hypothetical protein AWZ03_004695 [Drosophila navojoa]|uniref:SAM domain-containing protein n=1 Tax=Drosophila navojoa TaxID=7232 RepID=A0A484BKQ9_DRONA|nr:uncharacterized protein LOC108651994 [Drosophila navojoa]TDG48792.1 hypothetical protein AWZ03_004695 [Drosophila navojoa]